MTARRKQTAEQQARAANSAAGARAGAVADKEGFFEQHRAAILAGVGAVLVIGVGVVLYVSGDNAPPTRKVQEFTVVNVVPPPPPPPPPPPEQQPQPEEQKMVEAPPITEQEVKQDTKVDEPKDAPPDEPPPGPLGLDQAPTGPGDNFNLAGKPGGRGLLGGGGGGGSRWGFYTGVVTREVEAALRSNPKTRNGTGQLQVRIWTDQTGRITRVQLTGSSGNPEVDAVIRGEALVGLALGSAPPNDMPMPIVTRITMRQPS